MNFLFKWLRKKLQNVSLDDDIREDISTSVPGLAKNNPRIDSDDATSFTLWKADGGYVVETRFYNKSSEYNHNLYLITQDQDLGDRLTQIITYEAIKR